MVELDLITENVETDFLSQPRSSDQWSRTLCRDLLRQPGKIQAGEGHIVV